MGSIIPRSVRASLLLAGLAWPLENQKLLGSAATEMLRYFMFPNIQDPTSRFRGCVLTGTGACSKLGGAACR